MNIWIFDYRRLSVTKFVLTQEHEQEIEDQYCGCVEDFLYDHETLMNISMNDSTYMVTRDTTLEVVLY